MGNFEIYATDLNEKTQKELCAFFGVKSVEDMNWDTVPIAIMNNETDD